jgi:diguanylate cyclase
MKGDGDVIPVISGHSMFMNMMEQMSDSCYFKDRDFRFIFANQSMAGSFGMDNPAELEGKTDFDFLSGTDAEENRRMEGLVLETGKPAVGMVKALSNPDGPTTWISSSIYPLYGEDGSIIGIWGTGKDITEFETAKNSLHETLVRYRQLSEQSRVFTWEVDDHGLYTFADPMVEALTGYSAEELIGKMHFYDLCPEEGRNAFMDAAFGVFARKEPFQNLENKARTKNGQEIWLSTNGIPLLNDDGTLKGYHGNDTDITMQKDRDRQIIYLSYHDQLTGLYNRRFYEEELNRLDTERNLPISIVMGDVNGLKLVNDSFGHAMGDELLKKAADVIRRGCRADDIVARLGGDEFVVLLPNTTHQEAESFLKRIADLSEKEKVCSLDVSISFGCRTKYGKEESIQDVFKSAEDHMYRNKLSESSGMRSRTIGLIMNALYEKYNREQLHSIRVSELCAVISSRMHFGDEYVAQVRMAGLLHDIGKIEIDGLILNKPVALNPDEWEEMKRHPEIGYRILSSVNEFMPIADFVLEHQERWDGKGYPRGLAGERISLQARIIAVADSYDAMTTNRTYGRALSEGEAVDEMERCSGTQFDPSVVKALTEIIREKGLQPEN